MGDFRESAKGFGQGGEAAVQDEQHLGGIHAVILGAEALEAVGEAAFTGKVEVVSGVVIAEALAA